MIQPKDQFTTLSQPGKSPRRHGQVVYLAGPMRGLPEFNFPAFHHAARILRTAKYVVISPAEHDEEGGFDPKQDSLEGFDVQAAMRWDVQQVLAVDAVVVLPGWRDSYGCAVEAAVARAIGTPVLEYPNLNPVDLEPSPLHSSPPETHESICLEAHRIVNGARQAAYGHPAEDFSRTAKLWEGITGAPFTPEQVALCMIAVKISRLCKTPGHRDSVVDIAGYAQTLEYVQRWRQESTPSASQGA